MLKFLFPLLLLSTHICIAQKEYSRYRKTLEGLTCNDPQDVKHSRQNIPLLENWISIHPKHYAAYYDLAMCYFSLCGADSANRNFYSEKCIESNKQFIRLAPERTRYQGYWNNAVLKCWLKDCKAALDDLDKAKQSFKLHSKHWDATSEKSIRTKCISSASSIH